MVEIERKFLVTGVDYKKESVEKYRISQGYLNSHPERTVRVRIMGDQAFITVKGKSSASGLSRYEWEKEIAVAEAEELLLLSEPGKIEKVRYNIHINGHTFEVDEFFGSNEGLVLAEIELTSEDADFPRPLWLGEEVTGDSRYYNSQLIQQPYGNWKKE